MDEIQFLICHYTGNKSKTHKNKPKKFYTEEQEEDEMEEKTRYNKIMKKIPKNLLPYVEVSCQIWLNRV